MWLRQAEVRIHHSSADLWPGTRSTQASLKGQESHLIGYLPLARPTICLIGGLGDDKWIQLRVMFNAHYVHSDETMSAGGAVQNPVYFSRGIIVPLNL